MMSLIFGLYILYCLTIDKVLGTTLTDMERLHQNLTSSSRYIKPKLNQSEQIDLRIFLSIAAFQDYDVISGTLSLSASFSLSWTDELKVWNPESYGGINLAKIPISET